MYIKCDMHCCSWNITHSKCLTMPLERTSILLLVSQHFIMIENYIWSVFQKVQTIFGSGSIISTCHLQVCIDQWNEYVCLFWDFLYVSWLWAPQLKAQAVGRGVPEQQRADGQTVSDRTLQAVQQHICVDEFGTARLGGQNLQHERLQCRASAGEEQCAQTTEVCFSKECAVVLRGVGSMFGEDLQGCVTIDTEFDVCAFGGRGEESLSGEE